MKDVNNLIHINKINCNLYGFQNQFKSLCNGIAAAHVNKLFFTLEDNYKLYGFDNIF